MSEPLDILADLDNEKRRPVGTPCRIAYMRRDRPDLLEQWDRVMAARREGTGDFTYDQVAAWFTGRGFPMTRNTPERHIRTRCTWCDAGIVA